MNTTPEQNLLNYCETFGHKETARILREIVDKQREPWSKQRLGMSFSAIHAKSTQNRDANADSKLLGGSIRAAFVDDVPELPNGTVQIFREQPLVSRGECRDIESAYYESLSAKAMRSFPKHKFIYLDGAIRQDPACL